MQMVTSNDCSHTFDFGGYLLSGDAAPCPPFGASVHIKGHASAVKKEKSMSTAFEVLISNNDLEASKEKHRRKNDARKGRKQKKVHES